MKKIITVPYGTKDDSVELNLVDDFLSKLDSIALLWSAFFPEDVDGFTITSGSEGYSGDGVHGKNSFHYKNGAIDARIKDVGYARIHDFCTCLSILLGKDYDVVVEKDHIHIERDVS